METFSPDTSDAHYVSGYLSIIVKPLVSQSPLIDFGGVSMPSLEKEMVDIASDAEFAFAQGAELNTIYGNILSSFEVNEKALYRYADRRGWHSLIESLIKASEL